MKTIDIIYETLIKSGQSYQYTEEFTGLVSSCVKQNICFANGKIHLLPDGLPMGGPLSSLMADIFMDRLERWALKSARFSSQVLLWFRFVDDILCFWLGTDMELEIFTSDLQKFDDNLSFTVERAEHLINFLNITISLKHDEIEDGLLTPHFSVYRKSEFTGVSIHNRLYTPPLISLRLLPQPLTI